MTLKISRLIDPLEYIRVHNNKKYLSGLKIDSRLIYLSQGMTLEKSVNDFCLYSTQIFYTCFQDFQFF